MTFFTAKEELNYLPEGELDGLTDGLLHPHAKERPGLVLIKILLDALMESNPRTTAKRLLTDSLPN